MDFRQRFVYTSFVLLCAIVLLVVYRAVPLWEPIMWGNVGCYKNRLTGVVRYDKP